MRIYLNGKEKSSLNNWKPSQFKNCYSKTAGRMVLVITTGFHFLGTHDIWNAEAGDVLKIVRNDRQMDSYVFKNGVYCLVEGDATLGCMGKIPKKDVKDAYVEKFGVKLGLPTNFHFFDDDTIVVEHGILIIKYQYYRFYKRIGFTELFRFHQRITENTFISSVGKNETENAQKLTEIIRQRRNGKTETEGECAEEAESSNTSDDYAAAPGSLCEKVCYYQKENRCHYMEWNEQNEQAKVEPACEDPVFYLENSATVNEFSGATITCPSCNKTYDASLNVCPNCGMEYTEAEGEQMQADEDFVGANGYDSFSEEQ